MLIYLIGPSGVGKTSCAAHASKILNAHHHNLDVICSGHQFDWAFCVQELHKLESAVGTVDLSIVDIGAGTQCLPGLCEYLKCRRSAVIHLYAPSEEVLRRNPLGPNRPLEEYNQTESTSRQPLYLAADHVVNITANDETTSRRIFVDYLRQHFSATFRASISPL